MCPPGVFCLKIFQNSERPKVPYFAKTLMNRPKKKLQQFAFCVDQVSLKSELTATFIQLFEK